MITRGMKNQWGECVQEDALLIPVTNITFTGSTMGPPCMMLGCTKHRHVYNTDRRVIQTITITMVKIVKTLK